MVLTSIKDSKLFVPGEPITLTVFPNIQAMISGVSCIHHSHPRYMLEYIDKTAEEATVLNLNPDEENLFTMVSAIQDAARR